MKSRLVPGAVDILAGLAVLVLFILTDAFIHVAADFREAVLVLSVLLSVRRASARMVGQ